MRVLVLGATGFIGGQIARMAHATGMEVHGLRRRRGAVGAVGDVPIVWHDGDLADPLALSAALEGCEVLFHAAAQYPTTERSVRRVVQAGVRQMRSVLSVAQQTGVKRVVYTSSLSTIGLPPSGTERLADERDGYLPGSTTNPYYEVKWTMEHEALRATVAGLPVIILCPAAVFGPGDVKPSTSQILLMVAKGQVPVGVDVVTNIVDGRDVALAHVRAATLGVPGERYIIGGHNLNVAEALREAARLLGVRPPRGVWSMRRVRAVLGLAKLLHLPIPATMMALPYWQPLNAEKGWRTFGFTPRPFEETVMDTVAWFRDHGYLASR